MERGHQHNFSDMVNGAMYDGSARERKARTILAAIQDFLVKQHASSLQVLDVGSSTGIIDNYLADHFGMITGIDIDTKAVDFAKKTFVKDNLKFQEADAMALEFQDDLFDLVICTHIYEHVPNSQTLLNEIYRVLKPGGICYFAAGNRLSLIEPHYSLPFLSILPRPLAHIYMRLAGKGNHYHEKHLTLPGLKSLVHSFTVHDYTNKIIDDPLRFNAEYMLKPNSTKHNLAKFIANYAYWLCPTYIWILEKPNIR